jgi:CRISPR-associated endonuclease/helicase Cas3
MKLSASTNDIFLSHPIEETKHLLIPHSIEVATKTQSLISETEFDTGKTGYYAGLLHDIGKLNPFYQEIFRTSKTARKEKEIELSLKYEGFHSPFSAWAALRLLNKMGEISKHDLYKVLVVIYGHHSKLRNRIPQFVTSPRSKFTQEQTFENLLKFKESTKSLEEYLTLDWDRCIRRFRDPMDFQFQLESKKDVIKEFLEISATFSSLLQADRGSFSEWATPTLDLNFDTSSLINSGSELQTFRSLFQDEAMNNHDPTADIVILNAPTGIGKTKVFLDLIGKYRLKRSFERVFYFSPLLALSDDFEKKLAKTTTNYDEVLIYNHIFSGSLLEKKKRTEKTQWEPGLLDLYRWYFDYESFNKEFIITTMQRLLITLYSNKASDRLKLLSLKHSILILDEVQTLPKFLLPNLIQLLTEITKSMKSKVILVSATIPYELSSIPTIKISQKTKTKYLQKIRKKILFLGRNFRIPDCHKKKVLLMLNTRRKTTEMFRKLEDHYGFHSESTEPNSKRIFYLSSGIRKRDRISIINNLTSGQVEDQSTSNDCLVISTQVIEAGVDISFSEIYREAAPIDSIVQVMGRLNREGNSNDATLFIFQQGKEDWHPYSELEYKESLEIIRTVATSDELYDKLGHYYRIISEKNQSNIEKAEGLGGHFASMDFDRIWEFVDKHALPDDGDNVFIPYDLKEWDDIKSEFMLPEKSKKGAFRKFINLTASLPKSIRPGDYLKFFDEDLVEKNVLLPKRRYYETGKLGEIYHEKLGFDILL